jgi:AcrR family transcriptional regulator
MRPVTAAFLAARAALEPGRLSGRRAQETRRRILTRVHELLETTAFRDLAVADVARDLGVSPGTFYHYFSDMETAVLALARQLAGEGARLLSQLVREGEWDAGGGRPAAAALVDGFLAFWREHRFLLRVIDLSALEGDAAFRTVRARMLRPVTEELAGVIGRSRAGRAVPGGPTPRATAGVLVGMLANNAAHRAGFRRWHISAADLREAMIGIVSTAVAGPGRPARAQRGGRDG